MALTARCLFFFLKCIAIAWCQSSVRWLLLYAPVPSLLAGLCTSPMSTGRSGTGRSVQTSQGLADWQTRGNTDPDYSRETNCDLLSFVSNYRITGVISLGKVWWMSVNSLVVKVVWLGILTEWAAERTFYWQTNHTGCQLCLTTVSCSISQCSADPLVDCLKMALFGSFMVEFLLITCVCTNNSYLPQKQGALRECTPLHDY